VHSEAKPKGVLTSAITPTKYGFTDKQAVRSLTLEATAILRERTGSPWTITYSDFASRLANIAIGYHDPQWIICLQK
jgi:hypothetical protein